MKNAVIVTLVAGLACASGALANGIVRDSHRSAPAHSALGIGYSAFSIDAAKAGVNNFSDVANPFTTGSGGNAFLYTDVDANSTGSSNFKNLFPASTTTSQLSAFKWYINGATSAGGNRQPLGAGTFGSITSQVYNNNTSLLTYNNVGTGNWRGNVQILTIVTEGVGNGTVNVYSQLKFTRTNIAGGANNAQNIDLSVASFIDLDVGSNGDASDTVTDISGAGERRFRYVDSSGIFGQTLAKDSAGTAPSFRVAARNSTFASALEGSGASLGNTIAAAGTNASGYLWARGGITPAGSAGSEAIFEVAFSIGQSAIIPTPGAAALLGLGGLVAGRRRR